MLDLAGQSQVSGDVSASSVSGAAEAASGANVNSATQSTAYTVWAYDSDASTVSGLKSIDIDVASDATILGTAFGDFSPQPNPLAMTLLLMRLRQCVALKI